MRHPIANPAGLNNLAMPLYIMSYFGCGMDISEMPVFVYCAERRHFNRANH
jgi:hypothetical protein